MFSLRAFLNFASVNIDGYEAASSTSSSIIKTLHNIVLVFHQYIIPLHSIIFRFASLYISSTCEWEPLYSITEIIMITANPWEVGMMHYCYLGITLQPLVALANILDVVTSTSSFIKLVQNSFHYPERRT